MEKNYFEEIENKLRELGWISDNTVIVNIIKDCLITETFTGKSYSYRVVNFVTGDQKYLFHKRKPIDKEQLNHMKEKLQKFDSFGTRYPETGEGLIKFIFEVVFRLYGYSLRVEQVDLSIQMYQSMINRKISLSDVPVGLGKTHAYLVAAIVWRINNEENRLSTKPVIITTSSIELQRAIVKEYLPEISQMLVVLEL